MGDAKVRFTVSVSIALALSYGASKARAQSAEPAEPGPATRSAPPAEERTANNALYVEGLGPALLYSLNYDRAFGLVAGRIGVEYLSLGATAGDGSSASVTFVGIPITVSYLGIGSLKHMFEIGGGVAIWYFGGSINTLNNKTSGSTTAAAGTVILGYRYQPPDGGFFFRGGLSPLISTTGTFLPWPYLALGATF